MSTSAATVAAPRHVWRPVRQAAALALGYPGPDWADRLRLVREACEELSRGPRNGPAGVAPLLRFCAAVAGVPPLEQAQRYVATFDRSRRRALYLTYYTDGDTRRRGGTLAAWKARYRAHGLEAPGDELPDHLPLVLEFAARCPAAGTALLVEYRPALELLRTALTGHGSPYAEVLRAVCDTLPGLAPADRAAALALARGGPPAETVGLAPFGTASPAPARRPGRRGGEAR